MSEMTREKQVELLVAQGVPAERAESMLDAEEYNASLVTDEEVAAAIEQLEQDRPDLFSQLR